METVVITGSNRGIGLELAALYGGSNRHVIAGVRDVNSATRLRELVPPSQLDVLSLDVTNTESIQAFQQHLTDQPIDILINNAGFFGVTSRRSRPWTTADGHRRWR